MRGVQIIIPVSLLLASCAGQIETHLVNSGALPVPAAALRMSSPPGQSIQNKEMQQLIAGKLQANGLGMAADGPYLLQVAYAEKPAALALKRGDQVISIATKKRSFDNCKRREIRLSLHLTQVSDGKTVYSGEVVEHHCKASVSEVLPALANALVADFSSARGSKITKRIGKD